MLGDSGNSPLFDALVVQSLSSRNISNLCRRTKCFIFIKESFKFFLSHSQEAIAHLHDKSSFGGANIKSTSELGLDDLNIGAPIAKGCSAIVYAAAFKDARQETDSLNTSTIDSDDSSSISIEPISPIQNTTRYTHNFGTSLENPHFLNAMRSTPQLQEQSRQTRRVPKRVRFDSQSNRQHSSIVSSASPNEISTSNENISILSSEEDESHRDDHESYPLALKMMFNYDIQSNAMSILRAMHKETIPAINKYCNDDATGWEKLLMEQSVQLPPHPNIVLMFGTFCAQIPDLQQSSTLIPSALPQRLNPNGYGRNMSLFMLMKRYEYTLREYLNSHELSMRSKLILFAQLLEGVAHLYRHGVAHRDLKSDNILIDSNGDDLYPILVLSDFGCCSADKSNGLSIPYTSFDMDKGGNAALMAPEIATKRPGTFSVLDYSKSDLWAVGTLAYEIFGSPNPFYKLPNESTESSLVNSTYNDVDLPPLNENVPTLVQKLVNNILHRSPNQRLAPDVAANVMQLFLWAPSTWLNSKSMASSAEVLQWLLSLTTKVLYETRLGNKIYDLNDRFGLRQMRTNRTHTEFLLISSFLLRAQLQQIRSAVEWIRQTNELDE